MTESADRDLRVPRFVRRSPTAVRVKLCPRCLNPVIQDSKLGGWLIPADYICKNCGYRGPVFIESDQSVGDTKRKE
jgi:predicted RNA-binding Zn-ribbon protein involved in translation (DUF1610 family)